MPKLLFLITRKSNLLFTIKVITLYFSWLQWFNQSDFYSCYIIDSSLCPKFPYYEATFSGNSSITGGFCIGCLWLGFSRLVFQSDDYIGPISLDLVGVDGGQIKLNLLFFVVWFGARKLKSVIDMLVWVFAFDWWLHARYTSIVWAGVPFVSSTTLSWKGTLITKCWFSSIWCSWVC